MFQSVKNIIIGIRVCRRYQLKFNIPKQISIWDIKNLLMLLISTTRGFGAFGEIFLLRNFLGETLYIVI